MEKSRQEKREARRRQEDAALNKMLLWFAAAIVYEIVVLLIKRFYIDFNGADPMETSTAILLYYVIRVFEFGAPVLTVLSIVWMYRNQKQNKATLAPKICIGIFAALTVTAIFAMEFDAGGVSILGMVAPSAAVLALVYYLYQREFFYNTVLAGASLIALLVYRKFYVHHPRMIYLGFILVWLGLAAAAYLAWKMSQNDGRWKNYQLFPTKAVYLPTYLTAAISALTLVITLVAQAFGSVAQAYGATAAYYCIFAQVTWLFCMAVYYTVKLM